MKKNRGFTLVEVITVLVLLSVLIVIASPVISSSSNKAKYKLYDTKIKMLENAAIMYAQDNYGDITMNCSESTNCVIEKSLRKKTITVKSLVPNYYKADTKEPIDNKQVEDPRKPGQFLDEKTIVVTIDTSNRKITAKFNE